VYLTGIPAIEGLQVIADGGPLGGIGQRGKVNMVNGMSADLVAIGIQRVELGLC
jgi:hypothetical protein